MRIVVGCDMDEFRDYYRRSGIVEEGNGLGETEAGHIRRDGSHLIVFRDEDRVIGHAIWHESNTREHTPGSGSPREPKDTEVLERLLGGRKSFVELHELWLVREHRGRGYGKEFFDFFENFLRKNGHRVIIYYAFDPPAVALCRRRGYREAYGVGAGGHMNYVLYLRLHG